MSQLPKKIRLLKDVDNVMGQKFKAGDCLYVHSVTVRSSPQSQLGICGLGHELFEFVCDPQPAAPANFQPLPPPAAAPELTGPPDIDL